MTTAYVALLGRINVGGRNVTMVRLREIVAAPGYTDVGTYIQTGNVFFRAAEADPRAVETTLARHLEAELGYPVPTFVRSIDELAAAAASDPFTGLDLTEETRFLVLATATEIPADTQFPITDEKKGLRLLGAHGRQAFIVLTLVNGCPANAVEWFERRFDISATGRFAHTLAKILDAARAHLA